MAESSPSRAFLALWEAARRREPVVIAGVTYSPQPEPAGLHARVRSVLLMQTGFLSPMLPAFSPDGADRCAAELTKVILSTSPWHPLDGPWQ